MVINLNAAQAANPSKIITRTTANIPSYLAIFVSCMPEFFKPSSERVELISSNFEAPISNIGSVIGFRVIALSICSSTNFIVADHIAKN